MKKPMLKVVLFSGIVCLSTVSFGHEIYQDVLEERYTLKSFSCKTCHPDSDDRRIRSSFAELIYQQMKDKNYEKKWAEVEGKGDEAIAEFEKEISKDFAKAMEVIGKKQMSFDDLIKAGLFNGARLDTKKIEKMKAAQKATESKK